MEMAGSLRDALSGIDDDAILSIKGISQFRKLDLLNIKYGETVINKAELRKSGYYYRDKRVLNLAAKDIAAVKTFDISDGRLLIEGLLRASASGRSYECVAADENGKEYPVSLRRYEKGDIKGFFGETLVCGEIFSLSMPVSDGSRITFHLKIDGQTVKLKPGFAKYTNIRTKEKFHYCREDGYLVRTDNGTIMFRKDNLKNRIAAEVKLAEALKRNKVPNWQMQRAKEIRLEKAIYNNNIRKQAAFVTVRSDGELADNIAEVYAKTHCPKAFYAAKDTRADIDKKIEAAKIVYSSKVVVTDDYYPLFKENRKHKGQYYIQLWHAAGAFKRFGNNASNQIPSADAMSHRDYDLVVTSGEKINAIYADAFQVDVSKVQALGTPRTDKFFDGQYVESRKKLVYDNYPQLKGKRVIVYAPTFREKGTSRSYLPNIDYKAVDDALSEDQVFVICPHPLMGEDDGEWNYDKIMLVQDVSTADMMLIADLLITDYSSIIFDYSLLNKPMAFFCYDYDTYERDFYLDYDTELPGEIFKNIDELTDYLRQGIFETDRRLTDFRNSYMSACDGHSAERVAKAIEELLDK